MTVKQNTTVVGTIDRAGDVDYFRFPAAVGDQVGVQITATELGSKLDPVLVLTDDTGAILAEGAAALGYAVRKAGTYAIGVRDRDFRGGSDFAYRLHVGNVPVVTGVFPLAAQRGRATSVHVSGVNLGAERHHGEGDRARGRDAGREGSRSARGHRGASGRQGGSDGRGVPRGGARPFEWR